MKRFVVLLTLLWSVAATAQSHNCDTIAPTNQTVDSNVPFRIQYCHPKDDLVEGVDVSVDNGAFTSSTPKDLGLSTSGAQRGYEVSVPIGLSAGPHSIRVISWNFKRVDGKTTTEKQFSPAVSTNVVAQPPKFTVGQRIQVYSGTESGSGAAVRSGPGIYNDGDPIQPAGSQGSVVAGPTDAAFGPGQPVLRWWQINFDVGADGWVTEPNIEPAVSNVDCIGSWSAWNDTSEWSTCSVDGTQSKTQQRMFTVTTPAQGTGKACEVANGTTQNQTITQACTPPVKDVDCDGTWSAPLCGTCVNGQQSCSRTFTMTVPPQGNGKACPVSPEVTTQACSVTLAPPKPTSCRWTLTAVPPDSTQGWRAQFRQNGVAVGSRDNTSPFDRTFTVTPGTYKYDVEWSKTSTSVPKQISGVLTMTCSVQ